jgi:hypothetical protein
MRYWSILAAKLAAGGILLYAIWLGMNAWYQVPDHIARWGHSPFLHDLKWTTMVFGFHLLAQGVLFAIVWDQRRRCRTCGRLLRMPVSHGRYGQMLLFGRPRTDYICVYGHGTLQVPELHVGAKEPSDWKANDDDIWKELYSLEEADRRRRNT